MLTQEEIESHIITNNQYDRMQHQSKGSPEDGSTAKNVLQMKNNPR